MADVIWIKSYVNMFSNRKIQILLNEPNGDENYRVWSQLLHIAGESNVDGKLIIKRNIPYTLKDFAKIMGKSFKKIDKIFKKFLDLEMIVLEENVYRIKNWEKYQNTEALRKMREGGKERQQRHRDKLKEKVTLQ